MTIHMKQEDYNDLWQSWCKRYNSDSAWDFPPHIRDMMRKINIVDPYTPVGKQATLPLGNTGVTNRTSDMGHHED